MRRIRLLMCQTSVTQLRDLDHEWVEYDTVKDQLEKICKLVAQHKPELVVLPETCYFPRLENYYTEASKDCLIVAGSSYDKKGVNQTHVFVDGRHSAIGKIFPSPKEVMENNYPTDTNPDEVYVFWRNQVKNGTWPEYFFDLPGTKQKVAVLNCMDYYRLGYYVANCSEIAQHLWGIISPCSNGQQDIFLRLSSAIHDSNSRLYSIVVNSNNSSRSHDSDQGMSYVFGPATRNSRDLCAEKTGIKTNHPASFLHLGTGAKAVLMDLLPPREVEFFARSRNFRSNPTGLKIFDL